MHELDRGPSQRSAGVGQVVFPVLREEQFDFEERKLGLRLGEKDAVSFQDHEELPVGKGIWPAPSIGIGNEAGDDRFLLPVGVEAGREHVKVAIGDASTLRIGRQECGSIRANARLSLRIEADRSVADQILRKRAGESLGSERELRSRRGHITGHECCRFLATLIGLLPPSLGGCGLVCHEKKWNGAKWRNGCATVFRQASS